MTDRPWAVEFERRAIRDLRRLDPPIKDRVIGSIRKLAADPAGSGLRRLAGREQWRLRVGDWRVIVELDAPRRALIVARVLPRGRAYDR